jgi:LemA protein
MTPAIILMIAIAVIAAAALIWAISTTNRFKVLLIKITEADSGIDVALTKRYDTLTKLIDVVKAYAKHETELFERVINLRSGMSMSEKSEVNLAMDTAAKQINLLAESYPELRSSENYKQLQAAIVDAEDHLQAARRVYNMNVSAFNQAIVMFPASLLARKHSPKEFFEAEEIKQTDVRIKL